MPEYKLIYFDARGRAEVSRLMFALADVKYEDVRLTKEEFATFKKEKAKHGQVPILEVDGKPFGQSQAIHSFVAKELGFHGKTNVESLAIDEIILLVFEFTEKGVLAHTQSEDKRAEAMKAYGDNVVPVYFNYFERYLKENGTGFFVGSRLTLADLSVFDFSTEIERRFQNCFEKFPDLKAFIDRIANTPRLKEYLAQRKETLF